jgi:hypothetical protein
MQSYKSSFHTRGCFNSATEAFFHTPSISRLDLPVRLHLDMSVAFYLVGHVLLHNSDKVGRNNVMLRFPYNRINIEFRASEKILPLN